MFAIGDKEWPGISKLIEEFSEAIVVCGKLMGSRGNVNHWSGNLLDMLYEELGDVQAATRYLVEYCGLDQKRIDDRAAMKLGRYIAWHKQHDPLPGG